MKLCVAYYYTVVKIFADICRIELIGLKENYTPSVTNPTELAGHFANGL